jgi:hypothetical protein
VAALNIRDSNIDEQITDLAQVPELLVWGMSPERLAMWPWIAVEGALQIAAGMMFKMLEMGDRSVVGGLMRADPAVAYRATLDAVWM